MTRLSADDDYRAKSEELRFAPGELSQPTAQGISRSLTDLLRALSRLVPS